MQSSLKDPVLVLNTNYEPLNVCTIRRAMGLIFSDKASMLANGRGEIHTSRDIFPAPSVIRLERMIKRPRPNVKLNKQEVSAAIVTAANIADTAASSSRSIT